MIIIETVCYKLIIMISLAFLAISFLGSLIFIVVQFTLELIFSRFHFHCNPSYVMCAHKTMM